MSDTDKVWSEEDSQMYRSIAKVAVPARREQIATMLTLLPFEREDSFRVAELGCGEGALTYAILDQFPNATALALDGSLTMRDHASSCLKPFDARANVDVFDLTTSDWLAKVEAVD